MLGLTREQIQRIEDDFDRVPGKSWREELAPVLAACTPQEALCMRFLYAYAPAGDIGNVPPEVYLHTVRATLCAQKELPWAEDGARFFSYVLPLRVNNEALSDHRVAFYKALLPRISGKTRQEAMIEAGYWCAEQATYRSTDDRTASPLGVLRRGFGRCGEESTLAVCALRSIGIPARQVYVPYWAHCDDNHAWVEVWDGESWAFLGGCEPEEVLCRGWFTDTATCAMLVRARVFSPFAEEPMASRESAPLEVNTLRRYAPIKRLTVRVTYGGVPVEKAQVRFQLINYARLCTLTEFLTDADGMCRLETGYGDLYIEVYAPQEKILCHRLVPAAQTDVTVELSALPAEMTEAEGVEECTLFPPELQHLPEADLTDAQKAAREQKWNRAAALRAQKAASFYQGDDGFLQKTYGNFAEICSFLQEMPAQYEERRAFLQTLSEKDLSDVSADLLRAHFLPVQRYKSTVPAELFLPYVACPRVKNEELTAFRQSILDAFTEGEQKLFRAEPTACFRWIEEHITDAGERDFAEIAASPAAVLQTGVGGEPSKKLLCIAMLRTFGVPAMLRKTDGVPLFYRDGWHRADGIEEETGTLRLGFSGEDLPKMHVQLSLARLQNNRYETLTLTETAREWTLPVGKYRLLLCTRGRGGKVYAKLCCFSLQKGSVTKLSLSLPIEPPTPMQPQALAAAFVSGSRTAELHELLGGRKTVLAILEPGTEPTAHFIAETIAHKETLEEYAGSLLLLCRKEEEKTHPMLQTFTAQTGFALWKMDEGEAFRLMQRFGEQVKLPLVLLLDENVRAVRVISGYHVGTGELLVQHLRKSL